MVNILLNLDDIFLNHEEFLMLWLFELKQTKFNFLKNSFFSFYKILSFDINLHRLRIT